MKKIKDPIYGYIEIEDEYVKIIDSVYFQRLRNIIQTSYTSIYPSSLHNRFTHSIGVYNLGKLAFDNLLINSKEVLKGLTKKELDEIRHVFVFACLCHDLGHSPFSHTGEKFYNKESISKSLKNLINKQTYSKDLKNEGGIVGKEHEIMSALLALQVYSDTIPKKYCDFFARCIIGLQYKSVDNLSASIKLRQACIELLNSDIIDVDKLDYLIRDSYMSGYYSVSIDYNRLLAGVVINPSEGYPICYKKSALSVLESVLTAHDMERRWIQAHPIILYEAYLLQTVMRELDTQYKSDSNVSLLSLESLKPEGVNTNKFGFVRLLSDADIVFLAKQSFDKSPAVKEYFSRDLRRHPIWKSEAEYMLLFDFNKNKKFIDILQHWEDILANGEYGVYSLNDQFYEKLQQKAVSLNKAKATAQNETILNRIAAINDELNLLAELRDYFASKGLPFDLVIIFLKKFKSNIYKKAFKKLPILFNDYDAMPVEMQEVTHIPLDTLENNNFFYMYCRRVDDKTVDIQEFSKVLKRAAII